MAACPRTAWRTKSLPRPPRTTSTSTAPSTRPATPVATSVATTVACPSCGEENPARFRMCGICGTALQPAAAAGVDDAVPGAARTQLGAALETYAPAAPIPASPVQAAPARE